MNLAILDKEILDKYKTISDVRMLIFKSFNK